MNVEPILHQYCGSHVYIVQTNLLFHGVGKQQWYDLGPLFATLPEHCTIIGQFHHNNWVLKLQTIRQLLIWCGCGAVVGSTCVGAWRVRAQLVRGGCGYRIEIHVRAQSSTGACGAATGMIQRPAQVSSSNIKS